jgi:hypothetical protein
MTIITTAQSPTVNMDLPRPLYFPNGISFKVKSLSHHSVDCYLTTFEEDPQEAWNAQFTKDLEDTLRR